MKKDEIEIGDFISYKDIMMAVIDINEEEAYVLCNNDHKCKKISKDKYTKLKIVKKAGCKAIIRAFFDDMTYMR